MTTPIMKTRKRGGPGKSGLRERKTEDIPRLLIYAVNSDSQFFIGRKVTPYKRKMLRAFRQ
jgi:hypothetical protein